MLLNAREIYRKDMGTKVILLAFEDITEHKRLEDLLADSEERYRRLFETASDGIALLEKDQGKITHVNPALEEMLGYNKKEIIDSELQNFVVLPDSYDFQTRLQVLNKEGIIKFDDVPVTTNSGQHIDTEIYLVDRAQLMQCNIREITERKRHEEELRRSESYYRTIFDTSGAGMFIIEEDTTISRVNTNFEKLTGYSRQEVEGKKSWTEFVHPDNLTWMREYNYLRRQDPDAVPRHYELRFMRRHGEWRDVSFTIDMIPGTNKSIGSGIDITERKQMEQKLKEMSFHDSLTGLYNRNFFEEEMTRLDDARYSPIGIVVCDLDGLKFVNDALGHQAGDQMLIQTADILRHNFRSSDIIARIGGDEFAVLLTETSPEMVEKMLQRLRQAMQDYNNTNPDIPLSLSMGHAMGEGDTADMKAFFHEADNRMYREKIQRAGNARSAILQALTETMQARDFDTEGHCERLHELTASLARSLDLSQDFLNNLSLLARFHDLGKVGIPEHILFKSGPLTEEEWQHMRQHSEIGHRIASSVPDLEPIADYILKHHENWDGSGYPFGLSGEDIPLSSRILAIVDAYDAMTSDRPYRNAMTQGEAIAELRRCAGTQFDPDLVEKFIRIVQAPQVE